MFSSGPGGAWSQEASISPPEVGGHTASDAMRPLTNKGQLALRKKGERAHTTALWSTLEFLAPIVDENRALPGFRSKALRGRAKEELLKDVVHAVRLAQGLRSDGIVLQEGEWTLPRESRALSTPIPCARPCIGRADGRGVLAQGRRGCPRTGLLEHRRSSRGGWGQSSWAQQRHKRSA